MQAVLTNASDTVRRRRSCGRPGELIYGSGYKPWSGQSFIPVCSLITEYCYAIKIQGRFVFEPAISVRHSCSRVGPSSSPPSVSQEPKHGRFEDILALVAIRDKSPRPPSRGPAWTTWSRKFASATNGPGWFPASAGTTHQRWSHKTHQRFLPVPRRGRVLRRSPLAMAFRAFLILHRAAPSSNPP
jgi:hypothetical protein